MMEYRKLGKSGLHVSALALGSWHPFGSSLDSKTVREGVALALERGINLFDTAEVYEGGASDLLFGEALKGVPREEFILSTKIFWGGKGPTQTGLHWKHLVEGTKNALRRLQVEYVDILICHRPDPETPIEETLRAIDTLIHQGLIFYWGTSEWSTKEITEAIRLSYEYNLTPPSLEQPEYNLLHRARMEEECPLLCKKYGLGLTTWGPLAAGILAGQHPNTSAPKWLQEEVTKELLEHSKKFIKLCHDIGCKPAQVAIAWCLKNRLVSSVILGMHTETHLEENINALEVQKALTPEILETLDRIFPVRYSYTKV